MALFPLNLSFLEKKLSKAELTKLTEFLGESPITSGRKVEYVRHLITKMEQLCYQAQTKTSAPDEQPEDEKKPPDEGDKKDDDKGESEEDNAGEEPSEDEGGDDQPSGEEDEEDLILHIRMPDGSVHVETVTRRHNVGHLKFNIKCSKRVPMVLQKLHYGVVELEDDKLLGFYGMSNHDAVNLTISLKGGGKRAKAGGETKQGSKEDKVRALKDEIKHGVYATSEFKQGNQVLREAILRAGIAHDAIGIDTYLETLMMALPLTVLEKLSEGLSSNHHNTELKLRTLSKALFGEHHKLLEEQHQGLSKAESLLHSVAALVVVTEHMADSGTIDFSGIQKLIMRIIVRKATMAGSIPQDEKMSSM